MFVFCWRRLESESPRQRRLSLQNALRLPLAAFAESFWLPVSQGEEVACLESDLGLDFVPDQQGDLSWNAEFLCNRAIETTRYRLAPFDWSRVSTDRPLRCVLYRDSRFSLDTAHLAGWLSEMQQGYKLLAHETVTLPRYRHDEHTLSASS